MLGHIMQIGPEWSHISACSGVHPWAVGLGLGMVVRVSYNKYNKRGGVYRDPASGAGLRVSIMIKRCTGTAPWVAYTGALLFI